VNWYTEHIWWKKCTELLSLVLQPSGYTLFCSYFITMHSLYICVSIDAKIICFPLLWFHIRTNWIIFLFIFSQKYCCNSEDEETRRIVNMLVGAVAGNIYTREAVAKCDNHRIHVESKIKGNEFEIGKYSQNKKKLMTQEFLESRLIWKFCKFYSCGSVLVCVFFNLTCNFYLITLWYLGYFL
jgi:hypothetical protein